MQEFSVTVDFNGIVFFEPNLLKKFFGGVIDTGTNLYQRFTSTIEGDQVVDSGIVMPILGINDGNYRVIVRDASEVSIVDDLIVCENGVFPLRVEGRLVVADLAVLWEWEDEAGWRDVELSPGFYSADVRGFRLIKDSIVVECGYEVALTRQIELPRRSASLEKNMQVLSLP